MLIKAQHVVINKLVETEIMYSKGFDTFECSGILISAEIKHLTMAEHRAPRQRLLSR